MKDVRISIGEIVMNFSALELHLSGMVIRLLGEDTKLGAVITSEMSFQNLIRAFDGITKLKYAENSGERIEALEIIGECTIAEENRNKIIHSIYTNNDTVPGKIVRMKITAKRNKGLNIISEALEDDTLENICVQSMKAIFAVKKLYAKLFNDEIRIA